MRLDPTPILTPESIALRTRELAAQIMADYQHAPPTLVIVLKGALFFGADIARNLPPETQIEFIRAKSYEQTRSTGTVHFPIEPEQTLRNRHALIIEDVLDTGRTLGEIVLRLQQIGAASVKTCVLLDKQPCHPPEIKADYTGFPIGDDFVVGYGLDFDEHYRTLPGIHLMLPEDTNPDQALR